MEDKRYSVIEYPKTEQIFIFRCITKMLTVMLFLRLEEMGKLSIDDEIEGLPHRVTWRHVFSNTAGPDGIEAGTRFEYANDLWKHIPYAVFNATGL